MFNLDAVDPPPPPPEPVLGPAEGRTRGAVPLPRSAGEELRSRPLYAEGGWREARVVARERLAPGDRVEGLAVIQQFDATTVIEPGAVATLDEIGNLRIRVGA